MVMTMVTALRVQEVPDRSAPRQAQQADEVGVLQVPRAQPLRGRGDAGAGPAGSGVWLRGVPRAVVARGAPRGAGRGGRAPEVRRLLYFKFEFEKLLECSGRFMVNCTKSSAPHVSSLWLFPRAT